MAAQTGTAQRFTLDESKAREWLERAIKAREWSMSDRSGPEPAPGEDLPDIGADWDPLEPGEESTVFALVNTAATAGVIGKPDADTDVDFVYVDDEDGGYYFFLVYLSWDLKLASRSVEMRKLGERDATGITAALAILDEAVSSANFALTQLDEYIAKRITAAVPERFRKDS
jgi:hypothetical protein